LNSTVNDPQNQESTDHGLYSIQSFDNNSCCNILQYEQIIIIKIWDPQSDLGVENSVENKPELILADPDLKDSTLFLATFLAIHLAIVGAY